MGDPELPAGPAGRLRALFDTAAELPKADRERFFADLDDADRELRDRLLDLLDAHDRAGAFLEDSPVVCFVGGLDPQRLIGGIQGNPNQANLGDTVAAAESYRAALADRSAACAAYRESLDLWEELERTGLLREYDRPQLDHAAQRVAECTPA